MNTEVVRKVYDNASSWIENVILSLLAPSYNYMNELKYPRSSKRLMWNIGTLLGTIYNAVTVPLRFSFVYTGPYSLWFIDVIGDVLIALDILINLQSGFIEKGIVVLDRKRCLKHYRNGWLLLDMFTMGAHRGVLWMFNVDFGTFTRFPRMLRLLKLESYLLFLVIFLLIHWTACAYHFIGFVEGYGSNSFVSPASLTNETLGLQYLQTVYVSTVLLTGLGEVSGPETSFETGFCLLCSSTGFIMFAIIVGNIGEALTHMHSGMAEFRNKMEFLLQFMAQREIPEHIQQKIVTHYEYLADRKQLLDERAILNELPAYLHQEISRHLNYETIMKVNIFKNVDPGFINLLVLKMQAEIFSPNEFIFREGEIGREMFIISEGEVDIIVGNSVFLTLKQGDYFGDVALLLKTRRTAGVRARSFCHLFSLTKDDLDEVLEDYPEYCAALVKEAESRIKQRADQTGKELSSNPIARRKYRPRRAQSAVVSSKLDKENEKKPRSSSLSEIFSHDSTSSSDIDLRWPANMGEEDDAYVTEESDDIYNFCTPIAGTPTIEQLSRARSQLSPARKNSRRGRPTFNFDVNNDKREYLSPGGVGGDTRSFKQSKLSKCSSVTNLGIDPLYIKEIRISAENEESGSSSKRSPRSLKKYPTSTSDLPLFKTSLATSSDDDRSCDNDPQVRTRYAHSRSPKLRRQSFGEHGKSHLLQAEASTLADSATDSSSCDVLLRNSRSLSTLSSGQSSSRSRSSSFGQVLGSSVDDHSTTSSRSGSFIVGSSKHRRNHHTVTVERPSTRQRSVSHVPKYKASLH